jgi:AbrB family looped-hinge helix DNA binding protein
MKTIPMDRAGRVVLPKEVRRRLHLRAGDRLEANIGPEGLTLKPVRAVSARLVRSEGRVFRDVPGVDAEMADFEQAMGRGREERDDRAGGF